MSGTRCAFPFIDHAGQSHLRLIKSILKPGNNRLCLFTNSRIPPLGKFGNGFNSGPGAPRRSAEFSHERKTHLLALFPIGRGTAAGQCADPTDVAGPLRHTDGPARVQQVEGVRALQNVVASRFASKSTIISKLTNCFSSST